MHDVIVLALQCCPRPGTACACAVASRPFRCSVLPVFTNSVHAIPTRALELWLEGDTTPTMRFVHRISIRLEAGYDFDILEQLLPFTRTENNLRHIEFYGPLFRRLTQQRFVENGTERLVRNVAALEGPIFSFVLEEGCEIISGAVNELVHALAKTSRRSLTVLHINECEFSKFPLTQQHGGDTFVNLEELCLNGQNMRANVPFSFAMLPRRLRVLKLSFCGLKFCDDDDNDYEGGGGDGNDTVGTSAGPRWEDLPRGLTVVDLSKNLLAGPLDKLDTLPPGLVSLDLSFNLFSGKPDVRSVPPSLQELRLAYNEQLSDFSS